MSFNVGLLRPQWRHETFLSILIFARVILKKETQNLHEAKKS